METKKALIVVDLQRDFCPGGSLAVPDGDAVVPIVNGLLPEFELVIFTKDWHGPEMDAFASQHEEAKPFDRYTNGQDREDVLWPDHCVANTPGADFHPDLDFGGCAKDFYIFKKGMEKDFHPYSGFDDTDLEDFLDERGVTDVYVTGLALDFCVKDTALDAEAFGFKTAVIEDACRPIDPDVNETLRAFKEAGIAVIESWELQEYTKNDC